MDREEQKKLIIEIMQADEKDGLYEPVTNSHTLTAVEWLVSQLPIRMQNYIQKDVEIAKQMERQRIHDAMMYALDEDGHTGEWKNRFIKDYIEKIS